MTNQDYVQGLAKRYNVAYTQSDTDKLDEYGRGAIKYRELQDDPNADWSQAGISSPDQYEQFKRDLETQYQQRGASNGSSGSGGASAGGDLSNDARVNPPSTPTQAWNNPAVTDAINAQTGLIRQQQDFLRSQFEAQQAREAQQATQRDALYQQLLGRAQQSTQIDAQDPIIKGQVDAYRAEADRSQRNYLSDLAERAGPLANLRGEQRMAAERTGQDVGGFQAQLLGRELASRRAEIENALNSARGLLTAEQQAGLSRELSLVDKQMQGLGLSGQNAGLLSQSALGFGNLGLGYAGLDVQRRGQDLSMDQFLRDLALRQWDLGDTHDYRWATL